MTDGERGVFRDFEVTLTAGARDYVKDHYRNASCILEYGSGGSTMFAAAAGKTVITTESNPSWLLELMGAYKERKLPGDIIPIYVDLGETKEWGFPADHSKWENWPDYPRKAWQYCSENSISPDVVLIDGRFRVASFIASCLKTTTPMTVLFDDYVGRPHYHGVSNIIGPAQIIDSRLAVFEVEPGLISAEYLYDHLQYFHDPK
ncbi:MAG: hypothetical protein AB7G47_00730 [Mycolicibacterium sp.]|uniref:hypothetical protein n=1 Tax=Mycolicibacterium sp. TaxID=2320850 RepID=UPI003D099CDB